jgi:hypothetical protein
MTRAARGMRVRLGMPKYAAWGAIAGTTLEDSAWIIRRHGDRAVTVTQLGHQQPGGTLGLTASTSASH